MDPLTPHEYVEMSGMICPICQTFPHHLSYGAVERIAEMLVLAVACTDCHSTWKNVYALSHYAELASPVAPGTVATTEVVEKLTAYPNPHGFVVPSSELGDNWTPAHHLKRLRAEAEAKANTAMDHLMDQVQWEFLPRDAPPEETDIPYATHTGILHLPGLGDIRVYQLNTGMRVIDADDVQRLFGAEEGEA